MISTPYTVHATTASQQTAQTALNSEHHKECLEKRDLNPEWVSVNCRSFTANEASQRLSYTAQSDGIWLEGCNHQGQYKPDNPWKQKMTRKRRNTAPR